MSKSTLVHSRQFGITLIELMIVVILVAALLLIAMPSFAGLFSKTRVSTQTNAILETLHIARSYAITQQRNVHICHLDPSTMDSCDADRNFNSAWSVGWLVFVDTNNNKDLDQKDHVLKIVEMSGTVNIVFNQRGRLRFFPDGSARSAGFYICDRGQTSFRHVYLLHTGRARINKSLSEQQKSICHNINA